VSDGAPVEKRSLSIAGHRTSVSLEAPFWDALRALAEARGISVQRLVEEIDAERGAANLSSAIRVRILAAARAGDLPPTRAASDRDTGRAHGGA
jgi:predicted DNA-binding ribbon-helix-helix protein